MFFFVRAPIESPITNKYAKAVAIDRYMLSRAAIMLNRLRIRGDSVKRDARRGLTASTMLT